MSRLYRIAPTVATAAFLGGAIVARATTQGWSIAWLMILSAIGGGICGMLLTLEALSGDRHADH